MNIKDGDYYISKDKLIIQIKGDYKEIPDAKLVSMIKPNMGYYFIELTTLKTKMWRPLNKIEKILLLP